MAPKFPQKPGKSFQISDGVLASTERHFIILLIPNFKILVFEPYFFECFINILFKSYIENI